MEVANPMLAPYQELLERLRQDATLWSEVAYQEHRNEQGEWEDVNYRKRLGVLVCLQYDRRETDESLIRFLFQEESRARKEDPFQGESTAQMLAGFLLARFRRNNDLWLFWRAKRANFDTSFGFDFEFCFVTGIEQTLNEVKANRSQEASSFRYWLDNFPKPPTEQQMLDWWVKMERDYPQTEAEEAPLTLVQRALQLDEIDAGRRWLDVMEATLPPNDAGTLRTLMYYHNLLGQPEKALSCALQLRGLASKKAWDQASATLNIIQYATAAGQWEAAWSEVEQVIKAFRKHPDWKQYGLSLMTVEHVLKLAEPPFSEQQQLTAFTLAHSLIQQDFKTSYNVLKQAVHIAQLLNEKELEQHYIRLMEEEGKRIGFDGT